MSLPSEWLKSMGFQNRYFLLRHGQSEANVNSLVSSLYCVSVEQHGLTPLGITQSRESAIELYNLSSKDAPSVDILNSPARIQTTTVLNANLNNVIFYSSDFKRAYETAHYCKEQLKLHVQGISSDSTPKLIDGDSDPSQDSSLVDGEASEHESTVYGTDGTSQSPILSEDKSQHQQPTDASLTQLPSPYPALYTSPLLRERYFGVFEASVPSDEAYRQVWQEDSKKDVESDHYGVESIQSVVSRTTHLILELEQIWRDKIIVLVSHGDVCQIIQSVFSCIDPRHHRSIPHMNNAELREVFLVETREV